VKWHGIKVNVRFSLINSFSYLTFSSVRVVFGRSLPGFRSVVDSRSSTRLPPTKKEVRVYAIACDVCLSVCLSVC